MGEFDHHFTTILGWPTGKASGRMHHHDKHAATKDGHRPDDPHAVTGWKQDEIDKQQRTGNRAIRRTEQANAADMGALIQRHSDIQAVLNEPNIQREGHEVFDENVNYDQRVTAFGDIERDKSEVNQGDWDDDSDQLETDMGRGEDFDDGDDPGFIKDPSNAYARKGTFGQDYTYSKERRQHEAQTGTSLGRLAKPGAGDKEWEQTVARAR